MKSADDPQRLLDDPGETLGDLKLGLERFSGNLPDSEQVARLAAALGIEAGPPPPQPSAASSPGLVKLAVGVGVAGIVGLGIVVATRGSVENAEGVRPIPSVVQASSPASEPAKSGGVAKDAPIARRDARGPTQPGVVPETPPPAPSSTESSPGAPPAPNERSTANAEQKPGPSGDQRQPERTAPSAKVGPSTKSKDATAMPSPPSPPVAPPPSETELLRDARLVLDRDPAQALALSEQHRREYPGGSFSQEREVIAITALARLGRTGEAQSRAERFRSAYPRSPYIERIDRVVPP